MGVFSVGRGVFFGEKGRHNRLNRLIGPCEMGMEAKGIGGGECDKRANR